MSDVVHSSCLLSSCPGRPCSRVAERRRFKHAVAPGITPDCDLHLANPDFVRSVVGVAGSSSCVRGIITVSRRRAVRFLPVGTASSDFAFVSYPAFTKALVSAAIPSASSCGYSLLWDASPDFCRITSNPEAERAQKRIHRR